MSHRCLEVGEREGARAEMSLRKESASEDADLGKIFTGMAESESKFRMQNAAR